MEMRRRRTPHKRAVGSPRRQALQRLSGMIALLLIIVRVMFCASSVTAQQIRRLTLKDVQGKSQAIPNKTAKVTVLFFVTHDCPISNRYAPEINRICRTYSKQGVAFDFIYVDPTGTEAQTRKHLKEFGFSAPGIRDTQHTLVKMTGATVTPEVAILTAGGKRVYRGRIDDRIIAFGKQRDTPTQFDLRNALEAVLQNKPVPIAQTEAIGCFIPALH